MKNNVRKIFAVALGTVFTISTFALPARVDQPFMQAALTDLKQAQVFLRRATADKGGHRNRAMNLTASAINAVNNGIAYDRTHFGNRRRKYHDND